MEFCDLSFSVFLLFSFLPVSFQQPNPGLPSTHHRRVACSFRDQCLFQVFQISLTSLQQLKTDGNVIVFLSFFTSILVKKFNLSISQSFWKKKQLYTCSWKPVAWVGTYSGIKMFIIWFCWNINWWKLRWIWHCSGMTFSLLHLNLD